MSWDELPEFEQRPTFKVMPYAREIFGGSFVNLILLDNGGFRVLFRKDYFVLPDSADQPSKSQWSTLKKKMKRHDRHVFVFKQHGEQACRESGEMCYYIDFGFFAY